MLQNLTETLREYSSNELNDECTFYEERLLIIDVHETVGAGVAVASKRVPHQLLPRRLGDGDVIVLHPAALMRVVDVSPVVAGVGLAFMHQHCMKPIRDLGKTWGGANKVDAGVLHMAPNNVFHKWLGENVLTCIMDLSEYISSMVLWMRVMLPWRSVGENSMHKSFSEDESKYLEEIYYLVYFWANQFPSDVSCDSVLSAV